MRNGNYEFYYANIRFIFCINKNDYLITYTLIKFMLMLHSENQT